jgi:hypothetical protein
MQGYYPAAFERDMGCTEAQWLSWLSGAVRDQPLTLRRGAASVAIGGGALQLRWAPLPPRQIALMRVPRLGVNFSFEDIDEGARQAFMRYFDLYMQRGGG